MYTTTIISSSSSSSSIHTAHRAEKRRSKEEEASVGKEHGMTLMMDRWMTNYLVYNKYI